MKNNKTFLSEIHFRINQINLAHMETISAEPKSLYSDITGEISGEWKLAINKTVRSNPSKLINLLILYSRVKPFWYQDFLVHCMDQSQRYNYQGMWRVLHKLAKLQHFDLITYRVTEIFSPNEFFGNMIKEINEFAKKSPCKYVNQKLPKPKYPQRKRGYNDKGSVKYSHEVHDLSRFSGKNPEKEDYRSQYNKRSSILNFLYG